MEPLPRFLRFTFIGTGENPSGFIKKTAKKKIMAVSIFWDECARSHYLFQVGHCFVPNEVGYENPSGS